MSEEIKLRVLEDENPIPLSAEEARVIEAVSPTVELEHVGNETHMTVKDLRGTHYVIIHDGEKGDPGYTPSKGTDYWTEEDQETIIDEITELYPMTTIIDAIESSAASAKAASKAADNASASATAAAGSASQAASSASDAEEIATSISASAAQIETNKNDITNLKIAVNDIDGELHKRTKNLYDKNSTNPIDKKFINSQAQLADSDYNAFSGFMPCEPNTTYIFSIGGANVKVVSYWNDDTMLSRETIDNGSFTTPSNCNKIGFNLFAVQHTTEEFEYAINHAQLEKGTVATDYVPYIINALDTVVKTEVQELTADQKTQVRQNIEAASVDEVNRKLNAPSVAGTAGQVLTSDGQGGQSWQDATGGSVDVDETLTQSGKAADAKVVGDIVYTRTRNLYDKDSAGALDKKSMSKYGDLQDSNNNAFSGFIPCEPSTTYIFSIGGANVKVVSFFNDATFLGRETITNNGSFTTPSNCNKIGFNLFAVSHTTEEFEYAINHAQLEIGTVATDYVPYKIVISEKLNSLYTTYHGKNLYDKNTCVHEDKKSYNSSGIVTSGNSYAITGLIPCEGNSVYTFRAGDAYVQYVAYFHDQTFISREMIKGASFTTPANCNAVGFNLFASTHTAEQYEAAINSAQLEHGTQATDYEAYNFSEMQSYDFITGGIGENAGKAISQKAMTEILAYPRRSSWWKGKSGDSLGDSLTYKFNNFQRFVKPYLDLANFYNNGITGTKLAGASNTYGDSMWMDSRINALHEDADFITIFGGANDPSTEDIGAVDVSNYDTNTFAGAFNVIISKIYYRYLALNEGHYPSIDYSGVQQLSEPHNVLLLPCTVFYVPGGIAKLEEKANAVRTLSNAWGLRVVDFRAESQANPFVSDVYWTQSDNIHPTAKFYQERLAPLLINALEHLPPMEYPTEPVIL